MSRLSKLGTVKNNKSWIMCTIISMILVRFIVQNVILFSEVPSESMQPTMEIGERFFCVNTYFLYSIERGDIVVFYPNSEEESLAEGYWVKRVIGLPGDKININHGSVSVNGVLQQEDYVHYQGEYTCSFTIPEGKYFVCGDNREVSWDARKWFNPFINEDQIKFKVLLRISPLARAGNIYVECSHSADEISESAEYLEK